MKTRWKYLIAGFTMSVLFISVCTVTADEVVIWSDDFIDSNLPDWTIFAWESTESLVKIDGNFSAADGTLKALDDDMNIARRNSTMNVGTWSFDMFVPNVADVIGAMYVYIMSNGSRPIPTYPSDFIAVGAWRHTPVSNWEFIVWSMNGASVLTHAHISRNPMQGWHHIDVNRTLDGHFYVYINGTLETDFTYNGVTISTYLEFYSFSATGAAIDNLSVNGIKHEYPITTTPTTPTTPTTDGGTTPPPLPWEPIVIGSGVALAVIVLAIIFLKRR